MSYNIYEDSNGNKILDSFIAALNAEGVGHQDIEGTPNNITVTEIGNLATVDLAPTNVVPATYGNPINLQVDEFGRIISVQESNINPTQTAYFGGKVQVQTLFEIDQHTLLLTSINDPNSMLQGGNTILVAPAAGEYLISCALSVLLGATITTASLAILVNNNTIGNEYSSITQNNDDTIDSTQINVLSIGPVIIPLNQNDQVTFSFAFRNNDSNLMTIPYNASSGLFYVQNSSVTMVLMNSGSGSSNITSIITNNGLVPQTITSGVATIGLNPITPSVAGSYTFPSFTLNNYGQVIDASSNALGSVSISSSTLNLSPTTITSVGTINLNPLSPNPSGHFTLASINVNQYGQITDASSNTVIPAITSLTASPEVTLSPSTITSTGNIALTPIITPATINHIGGISYNEFGQITGTLANGGTVTQINQGAAMEFSSNPLTISGTIDLPQINIATAGHFTNLVCSTDAYGRVFNCSSGSGGSGSSGIYGSYQFAQTVVPNSTATTMFLQIVEDPSNLLQSGSIILIPADGVYMAGCNMTVLTSPAANVVLSVWKNGSPVFYSEAFCQNDTVLTIIPCGMTCVAGDQITFSLYQEGSSHVFPDNPFGSDSCVTIFQCGTGTDASGNGISELLQGSGITFSSNPINSSSLNPSISLTPVGTSGVVNYVQDITLNAYGQVLSTTSYPLAPIIDISGNSDIGVSGFGTVDLSLLPTSVTSGVYNTPSSITVDSKGRLQNIISGTNIQNISVTSPLTKTSDVSGNPIINLPAISPDPSGNFPTGFSASVDSYGRIHNPIPLAVGSGTVTSIGAGSGLNSDTTNPITSSGNLSIANTGVTAASYSFPSSVTCNSRGQLTNVVSGVQPITSMSLSSDLVGSLTAGVETLALQTKIISPGNYQNASVTVSATGLITDISSNIVGGAPANATYILQTANVNLPNAIALNTLGNGVLINTSGVLSSSTNIQTGNPGGSNNLYYGKNNLSNLLAGGNNNYAFGNLNLVNLTTGDANMAFGGGNGNVLTTQDFNVMIGGDIMSQGSGGSRNTALGNSALSAMSANDCTAVGYTALQSTSIVTGSQNSALGSQSLGTVSSGANNCGFGFCSGLGQVTGSNSVFIGSNSGITSNRNYNNSTFIGANTNATTNGLTNATAIGYNALVGSSNSLVLGNAANVGIGVSSPTHQLHLSTDDAAKLTTSTWTVTSDCRIKKNICCIENALEKLNLLNPVNYNLITECGDKERKLGFVADEVELILPECVKTSGHSIGYHKNLKTMNMHNINVLAVKAIQELSHMVLLLKEEIENMKK